jgi:hypothetical protein
MFCGTILSLYEGGIVFVTNIRKTQNIQENTKPEPLTELGRRFI